MKPINFIVLSIFNVVRQGGILSPSPLSVYVHGLSKRLIDARSDCNTRYSTNNY